MLRVLDFGSASPLRSQTLWHAVAHGVSAGAPPTLAFVRPAAPYVSVGFHRGLEEVDLERCRAAGLPVYRRMVGGGPVFCDARQQFFQIVVPDGMASSSRPRAIRALLEPAARAFREVGIDARLDDKGEIAVGDRKVCGSGAGQIDDAVIVVGNLLDGFDHATCADTLRVPVPEARAEMVRLMRRYVQPTPADFDAFKRAAVRCYAEALGLEPVEGTLDAYEEACLDRLDRQFEDPAWVEAANRVPPAVWRVKIRGGVWMFSASEGASRATASLRDGQVLWSHLEDPELEGEIDLAGRALGDAVGMLNRRGDAGVRLGGLLGQAARLW